jgi:hypothetical protein
LQRRDWLHRMSAANRLRAGFRQAEVLDLAFVNQRFDYAGDFLDRHVRINPMLVKQVDEIGLQSAQ